MFKEFGKNVTIEIVWIKGYVGIQLNGIFYLRRIWTWYIYEIPKKNGKIDMKIHSSLMRINKYYQSNRQRMEPKMKSTR